MEWECLSMETRQEQINRILKRQLSGEVQSFIEQVEKVGIELSKLYRCWEVLSSEDSDLASEKYPFEASLEDVIANYWEWNYALKSNFTRRVKSFSPTITVAELRRLLAQLDSDVQIVVEKSNGYDWLNIREVEIPDGESMFTLTLHTADDFRVTQL